MTKRELNTQTDRLIDVAFKGPGGAVEKLPVLRAIASQLEPQANEYLEEFNEFTPSGLRTSGFLACLPSIEMIASSRTHSVQTAQEVSNNFRTLSARVLATTLQAQCQSEGVSKAVTGIISEIGVNGVLWWSIASGRRLPTSYALPSTFNQDQGVKVEGYNIGTDVFFHYAQRRKPQKIQVKTAISKGEIAMRNKYYPDIAVVVLSDIKTSNGSRFKPNKILESITDADDRLLELANDYIDKTIAQSREKLRLHISHKRRQLLRQQLGSIDAANSYSRA